MNFFIVILLFATFSSSSGIVFNCTFRMQAWSQLSSTYSCLATISEVESNQTVTEVIGTHLPGRTNSDVKLIDIWNQTSVSFVPRGMENFFPNIMAIFFNYNNITRFFGDELNNFSELEWFAIERNPLERVSGDFFSHNPKMRATFFGYNRIKHVGANLLDSLQNLTYVHFLSNICINKAVTTAAQIPALIETLQVNCTDIDDETTTTLSPPTTSTEIPTTISTTTENPSCGNTNEIICNLQEQNQITVEKNSEQNLKINEMNLKITEMDSKIENLTQKNEEIKSEMSEMKEILHEMMQAILDLSSRPCGV